MKHLYTVEDENIVQYGEDTHNLKEARKIAKEVSEKYPNQIFWIMDQLEVEIDTYMNGEIY